MSKEENLDIKGINKAWHEVCRPVIIDPEVINAIMRAQGARALEAKEAPEDMPEDVPEGGAAKAWTWETWEDFQRRF